MLMTNNVASSSVPYWRLSGFYFFYFASLGVLVPYWSPYLKSLGYNSLTIGSLVAILPATKLIAPYICGWLADHTRRSMLIIRIACLLAVLSFSLVFISQQLWWLTFVMLLFSFFWNATLPQFEAMTLNHLGEDSHHYSMIRLWGSLGFIVIVVLIGHLLETYDADIIPLVVLFTFVGVLWAVGVLAEVIIFLLMHRLLPMFGARKLLLVTLLLTTIRWLLIGFFVDDLSMLFLAQLIHAFSFGVFHSVGISLVHEYFTGSHQGRGQALYASVSFGAGVAVGSLISGLVWDQWGAGVLFVFASCCTLLAMAIVWRFIQSPVES
jgi:MFS transporter, PPP family, 3-phenylpropionic acid transporter